MEEEKGVSFIDLLTIVFIALKLAGEFNYSWWIVFSPWLIEFGFKFIIEFIGAVVGRLNEK